MNNSQQMCDQQEVLTMSHNNGATKDDDSVDGVHHINIWIYGETEIGRLLSHRSKTPFTTDDYGPFESMEGFWQYITVDVDKKDRDVFRHIDGKLAGKMGKTLKKKIVPDFQNIIRQANYCRIKQNPELLKLVLESTLPFEHYWIFHGGKASTRIYIQGHKWLSEIFESIRTQLKSEMLNTNNNA